MRPNVFIQELNARYKYLQSKCHSENMEAPFEDRKEFFSVFNSFESSSKIEKCMERKMTKPIIYDIKNYKIPGLLPVMIMSFEDESALSLSYSFIAYYMEHSIASEAEKLRCKNFIREIMERFFKFNTFKARSLSTLFDEDLFYSKIFDGDEIKNLQEWVIMEEENFKL